MTWSPAADPTENTASSLTVQSVAAPGRSYLRPGNVALLIARRGSSLRDMVSVIAWARASQRHIVCVIARGGRSPHPIKSSPGGEDAPHARSRL